MSAFEDQQPWTNTYYVGGLEAYKEEHEHVPLEIGQGFIDGRLQGGRFRVEAIWLSTDSHGVLALVAMCSSWRCRAEAMTARVFWLPTTSPIELADR